jgi:hypothetical protein
MELVMVHRKPRIQPRHIAAMLCLQLGSVALCSATALAQSELPEINSFLSLISLTRSYNPKDVRIPDAPKGVFTITATFQNISNHQLANLQFMVQNLAGSGNRVLNATGDGRKGSIIPVNLGDDRLLNPGQSFTQAFQVGLISTEPFTLLVDAFGQDVSTTFTVFTNPADRRLLEGRSSTGDLVQYLGSKDANGLAIALDSIGIQSSNGDVTNIRLDEQSRPIQIMTTTGETYEINWQSAPLLIFTATSADGKLRLNWSVNLSNGTVSEPTVVTSVQSAAAASLSTIGQASQTLPRGGVAARATTSPLRSTTFIQNPTPRFEASISAASATASALIQVQKCGRPVDDAAVGMFFENLDMENRFREFLLAGKTDQPGVYGVSIPIVASPIPPVEESVEVIARNAANLLSIACEAKDVLESAFGEAWQIPVCATVAIVARGALNCTKVLSGLQVYCEGALAWTPGGGTPGGGTGQTDLAEFIADNIGDVVDFFLQTGPFSLEPRANIPGIGVRDGSSKLLSLADLQNPLPFFTVDAGFGFVEVKSLTANPQSPREGQSYTATAQIACGTDSTKVTMTVSGTDGYKDTDICFGLEGDFKCDQFVPAAAAGVIDTVKALVQEPLADGSVLEVTAQIEVVFRDQR